MNAYITGTTIRSLREARGLTQAELAQRLDLSDKAISKWETGRGLPDLTLIEPLAAALGLSVWELMSGTPVRNRNASGNMLRSRFYVCPVCGNVIHSMGEAVLSCCGVTLPALEAEEIDAAHALCIEPVEDEYYLSVAHPMSKQHYIAFLAWVSSDSCQLVKLYPEGQAACRMQLRGHGCLYLYCNHHGLMYLRR